MNFLPANLAVPCRTIHGLTIPNRTIPGRTKNSLAYIRKDIDPVLIQQIERIARRFEPALRSAFLAAVRSARRQATVQTIADAIQSIDPAAAIQAATGGLEFDQMRETLSDIVQAAGRRTTESLSSKVPQGKLIARFDIVNYYAVAYARREVGNLIQGITRTIQSGIQEIIAHALEYGGHPYRTARQIKGLIGLSETQTSFVLHRQLKLLAAGESNVDQKIQAYANKLLRQRSVTIARTESLAAANSGKTLAWLSAIDQGFLPRDVEHQWIITPDERLCEICAPMPTLPENSHVKVDGGVFLTGDGRWVKNPPDPHPNCRCTTGLSGSLK